MSMSEARLCQRCGQRPDSWFRTEGYVCTECNDELDAQEKSQAHALLIEQFRKALMTTHSDDWSMETVAEAAHICAAEVLDVVDHHRVVYLASRAGGLDHE